MATLAESHTAVKGRQSNSDVISTEPILFLQNAWGFRCAVLLVVVVSVTCSGKPVCAQAFAKRLPPGRRQAAGRKEGEVQDQQRRGIGAAREWGRVGQSERPLWKEGKETETGTFDESAVIGTVFGDGRRAPIPTLL